MAEDQSVLQQLLVVTTEQLIEGGLREKEAEKREKKLQDELSQMREMLATKNFELRKLSSSKSPARVEGCFKWEVELKKTGEDVIFSPYTDIGGLAFRIGCKTETKDWEDWLDFSLYCNDNSASKTYSANVACTMTVLSATVPCSDSFVTLFHPSLLSMLALSSACDANSNPATGRLHNGHITVEAQIRVIWYHKNALADFTSPNPELSDVILLVGGKVFHVDKKYLAHYAGYFKALFYSDFSEKNKESVKLDDIDPVEFEEMLRIIYPERKEVTAATVNGLLRMADFFDVPAIAQACTKFLENSSTFSLTAKSLLSEEFRLPELQYGLVEGLKRAGDVKAVINSDDFGRFSLSLRDAIYQKYFKLSSQ